MLLEGLGWCVELHRREMEHHRCHKRECQERGYDVGCYDVLHGGQVVYCVPPTTGHCGNSYRWAILQTSLGGVECMNMATQGQQNIDNREQTSEQGEVGAQGIPSEVSMESGAQESERDLRHRAHHHARPRLLWGVAAIAVAAVSMLVWAEWGDEIHEACFGENGACEVELGDVSAEADFAPPEGFE